MLFRSSAEKTAVRYVSAASSGIISTAAVSGSYPVYEMYAEVVSIPDGHAATISSSPASWADIAWDVAMPEDASEEDAKLDVTGDATIALAGVTLNKLTLNVSEGVKLTLTGALTVADSVVVTGAGEVDLTGLTITGTVVGDGTVVYASTKPTSGLGWTAATWTGTVKITNLTDGGYVPFDEYGNENSFIKAPGFAGYTKMNTSVRCDATLVIDSGTTFTLNDGNSDTGFKFSKLSGSGNLVLTGNTRATAQYVFENVSGFTGNVTVDPNKEESDWNDKSLVLGAPTTWTINTTSCDNYKGKLVIAGNVTVAAGKTFSGATVVNGTLTLGGTGSTLSGTVTGSGTVVCNQVDLSGSGFDSASGWTGKVQIVGDNTIQPSTFFDKASYGNVSSTLEVTSGSVAITTATSLPGTVNVASGATLYMTSKDAGFTSLDISGTNNGTIDLSSASSLTTLTLSDGIARGKVFYPSSLTTLDLMLKENLADDTEVVFPVGGGTTLTSATVTMYKPDGSTVNNTAVGTLSGDGHSITVTYTPTVDGSAAWCAYEFASNLNNSGSDTTALSADGTFSATSSVDGEGKLYTYSHPWRNITYPSDGNWSAMVRCTVPKLAEATVVTFGTQSAGLIGLAAGADPDKEMYLVQTTNAGGDYNSHYVTNAVMPVLNGTTAQHVYVFTVANNQTVKIYCDNELIETKVFDSPFTIGGGIQIGSVHGGMGSVGLHACRADGTSADPAYSALSEAEQKAARVDSMRLYKGVLGPNAIAQLSEEFPAVKLFEATISGGTENAWGSLGWSGGDIATLNAYAKVILAVTDDATLTLPPTLTLDELVFNVTAGKTLTLTGGGFTANSITVNGGTVACPASDTLKGTIKGSGTVRYSEGVLPASAAVWTSSEWMGTLVITNCGHFKVGGTDRVPFESLGNVYSKIKAPGFKGYAAVLNQNTICQAELVIDAGEGNEFEFNHGWNVEGFYTEDQNAGFKFRKLSGAGKLRLDGNTDFAQYVFCDVGDFKGDVDITYPEGGGRKSYLFGVPSNWEIVGSAYPANLVVASGMSVNANKKWDIPAGIILRNSATLELGDGSIITALSPKSDGRLSIPSGSTATLSNVLSSVVTTTLNIGAEATFKISDTALKSLTIPADTSESGATYANDGVLDLSGCTALETLHLVLGESQSFDDLGTAKLLLPTTCTNFVYDIGAKRNLDGYSLPTVDPGTNTYFYAIETIEEYANGGFAVSNVTNGADLWLIRQNGALIKTTASGTDRTYSGGSSFAGAACWHEWDFEQTDNVNKLNDSGACTTNNSVVATNNLSISSGSATYQEITVSGQEPKTALPSYFKPYPTDSLEFPTDTTGWSMALRCSMPTGEGKQVAIAFGDTNNGILGLASVPGGFVEMFNWTNGVYTTLASLKVEFPSKKDNMHLYVFTVTNGTITLYRDGEFIHTAKFALKDGGSITRFKVGDVCGDRPAVGDTLPAAITEANTGYVDYVRLYNRVIPESDVAGLSLRRPFVSSIETYERTIDMFNEQWAAADAWATKIAAGTADEPAEDKNVTLTSNDKASISINLNSDVKYGTLIVDGSGEIGLLHPANGGKIGAEMFVVRRGMDLIVDYNAVNLSDAVVGVDQGAMLTFDFTEFPFGSVTETTNIVLVGNVPAREYDSTCADRFALAVPSPLLPHIASVSTEWVESVGDVWSYKVTITPDHTVGNVYYKEGDFASDMTVYTSITFEDPTTLFAGDTLVVPAEATDSAASVDASFANDVNVTRSAFSVASSEAGTLDGRTIESAAGSTVNFTGGNFGEMTLAGAGAFLFDGDVAVARLSGTVSIEVADEATLTLNSVSAFVTGVTGKGTVKLPALSGEVNLNTFGCAGSVIELTSFDGTLSNASVAPALKLDGAVTISSLTDDATYSFSKISGSGNLMFGATGDPASITIGNVADYTGVIANNNAQPVVVTKITLAAEVGGGTRILLTSGTGTVSASSAYVGEAEQTTWQLATKSDGVYRASASYNDTPYATIQEAITAATDAHLDAITVLDSTADVPEGYVIEDGRSVIKVSVSTVMFNYFADYQSANVTAVVNSDGEYTLTVGETTYDGTAINGFLSFDNVDVSAASLGETTNYTISYGGSQIGAGTSSAKGNVVDSSTWMAWSDGGSKVGSWEPVAGPSYSEGVAAFSGTNTYSAAWVSTGEVVTVTTNVKFGDVADPDIIPDTDAQAAVRLGTDVNSATAFQVYTSGDWKSVYHDTLGTPNGDTTYEVAVKLNYSTQTYGVDVGGNALTNASGTAVFPLAKNASAMQKVSYLGAGSFISLSGQYVSAGYTADVGTDGSATNVVVSSDFVSTYMSDKLASDVSRLLDPNATEQSCPSAIAQNGLNYFSNYALGLNPTKADDKVIVDVTTDDSGKFVFTVKHPVFDFEGNITGYERVTEAANVTTTVTLKYGTSTGSIETVETGSTEGISPVDMFNHEGVENVLYYKAEVTIGAK